MKVPLRRQYRFFTAVAVVLLAGPSMNYPNRAFAASPIFSDNFDGQGTGSVTTGAGINQFTGIGGRNRLVVQTVAAASAPNALAASITGGGSAYAYKQYSSSYVTIDLTFSLELGNDVTLPRGQYVVVAQSVANTHSKIGKVDVTLPANRAIRLDYFDRAGRQHYLYGKSIVSRGVWHTVDVQETVGAGTGSLKLLVDGMVVAHGAGLDVGRRGITWIAVGDKYTPTNTGTSGHLYVDNVMAFGTAANTVPLVPGRTDDYGPPCFNTTPHCRATRFTAMFNAGLPVMSGDTAISYVGVMTR